MGETSYNDFSLSLAKIPRMTPSATIATPTLDVVIVMDPIKRIDYFSKSGSESTKRITKSFGAESVVISARKPGIQEPASRGIPSQ